MDLSNGGHLTHGSPVNMSGKNYHFISYGVDENGYLDYEELARKARENHPKMIVAGASPMPASLTSSALPASPREVGALFMVDMAHCRPGGGRASSQSGSLGGRGHNHHTQDLARPRGGLILCRQGVRESH